MCVCVCVWREIDRRRMKEMRVCEQGRLEGATGESLCGSYAAHGCGIHVHGTCMYMCMYYVHYLGLVSVSLVKILVY